MSNNWRNIGEITKSCRATQPLSYAWTIKNFQNIHSNLGDWLESPTFSTGNHEWNLDLYAAGYDQSASDYIGIQAYLHNKHKYPNVKLNMVCSIVDANDKKIRTETAVLTYKTLNEPAGAIKYLIMRKQLLSNPNHLPNNELRIICRFDFDEPTVANDHEVGILKKLYQNKNFSYFKFLVGGKEFSVHRAIVASASPVFEAMFESNMRESSEGQVNIDDIEPEIMESLLHFIYIGQLYDIRDIADKLLAAAEKYQLESLKSLCENETAKGLSVDSVYDILVLADTFNAVGLKKKTMDFFSENVGQLFTQAEFKTTVSSLPSNLQIDIICSLAEKLYTA